MNSIRDLQHMLDQIARTGTALHRIAETGTFDEATMENVMLFQRDFCPPITGAADQVTWEKIRSLYRSCTHQASQPESIRVFPDPKAVFCGGAPEAVLLIGQAMLAVLSIYVSNFSISAINGQYTEGSVRNINELQRLAGLPVTGTLDRNSWEVLVRLYEAIVTRKAFQQI